MDGRLIPGGFINSIAAADVVNLSDAIELSQGPVFVGMFTCLVAVLLGRGNSPIALVKAVWVKEEVTCGFLWVAQCRP